MAVLVAPAVPTENPQKAAFAVTLRRPTRLAFGVDLLDLDGALATQPAEEVVDDFLGMRDVGLVFEDLNLSGAASDGVRHRDEVHAVADRGVVDTIRLRPTTQVGRTRNDLLGQVLALHTPGQPARLLRDMCEFVRKQRTPGG